MSITKSVLSLTLGAFLLFSTADIYAQGNRRDSRQTPPPAAAPAPAKDTTKKAPEKGPVAIEKFFKADVKPMPGLTPVYVQDNRYYLEIGEDLLNRDILMVSRISKAAAGVRASFAGYAGDEINETMLRFEKGPNNKIFLREISVKERSADSTKSMFRALERSSMQSIVATFDVKALSADKKKCIIDVTDMFNGDSETFFFSKRDKTVFKLGPTQKDASYIVSIKTYPINTEVKSVKTYGRTDSGTATFELNCSFVLLPEKPMVARFADDRVGYFTNRYVDYDLNPQGIKNVEYITRFRLEPKPEDVDKYMRGELVEPAKPIIFYIDPATPKEWVPYLIQGVNDWEPVFRKAGFKNAIMAKEAPTPQEDPTWSLEDARFCAIVYKPSDVPNASGPHVSDPRSGEIIESHVNWYHNVMSLVHNWYMLQAGPSDPEARKMTFDTKLMGQLIRFVSSHEVGHTLGLRHNFAGSAQFTVEQLRNPKFLKENGHTTSIMDYSRFNYVAQPEDNIPQELLFPRIGSYDNWAIEWGYRRFMDINDPVKELTKINQWIIEKTKDKRNWFGTESNPNDPRLQSEDLGNDQMKANELGIKNLKFVMKNLGEWTKEPNEDYDALKTMHGEVVNQFCRYIGHVVKWVGGVYEEPKKVEEPGAIYTVVEKEKQIEAMSFLKRNLLSAPPVWLVPEEYLNKFNSYPALYLERAYKAAFSSLLSKRVILNLTTAEAKFGAAKVYTATNMFNELNSVVWGNLTAGQSIDAYKRVMQKAYVTQLCDTYTGADFALRMGMADAKPNTNPKDNMDATAVIYYQMKELVKKMKAFQSTDMMMKAHYDYLVRYIEKTLDKE
jgi:hypothetical protein